MENIDEIHKEIKKNIGWNEIAIKIEIKNGYQEKKIILANFGQYWIVMDEERDKKIKNVDDVYMFMNELFKLAYL